GAVNKRHRVLQLVAEAEGSARLVKSGPAPDPAPKCLVDQPAIEHQIQRAVGRADLHGPEDAIPSRPDLLQRVVSSTSLTIEPNEPPRVFLGLRLSEQEEDDVFAARRQLQASHQRGAGVAELTRTVGESLSPESGGRI